MEERMSETQEQSKIRIMRFKMGQHKEIEKYVKKPFLLYITLPKERKNHGI